MRPLWIVQEDTVTERQHKGIAHLPAPVPVMGTRPQRPQPDITSVSRSPAAVAAAKSGGARLLGTPGRQPPQGAGAGTPSHSRQTYALPEPMPVSGVDPRYRFLARFGATILSGGIAAIPMALYHYQSELALIPQEVWFVGNILAHRWTAALPYPSLRRMSRRTGVSAQMLHRYKQSLIEKGYLATIPRHRASGGRTSNYYDFSGLFHTLEHFLARDRRDGGWQPSVDDTSDENPAPLDTNEDDNPGDDLAEVALPVSQSHQSGDVKTTPPNGGRQLALTGGTPLRAPTPSLRKLPAPDEPAVSAPGQHKRPRNEIPFQQDVLEETRLSKSSRNVTIVDQARPGETSKRMLCSDGERGNDGLWSQALTVIETKISPAAFSAWLEPVRYMPPMVDPTNPTDDANTGAHRLICTSPFHRQQLDRRYRSLIEQALGSSVDFILVADNVN